MRMTVSYNDSSDFVESFTSMFKNTYREYKIREQQYNCTVKRYADYQQTVEEQA